MIVVDLLDFSLDQRTFHLRCAECGAAPQTHCAEWHNTTRGLELVEVAFHHLRVQEALSEEAFYIWLVQYTSRNYAEGAVMDGDQRVSFAKAAWKELAKRVEFIPSGVNKCRT